MERMGDILAKVAGRRASLQSKTRRTSTVRKKPGVTSASGMTGMTGMTGVTGAQQTTPAPGSAQQERPTEARTPRARTLAQIPPAQTKIGARPSVQASASARQPQPVRRPTTSAMAAMTNAQALPDALESPAAPKGPARATPDAEPILEMPIRRRASATPTPVQAAQVSPTANTYAAEVVSGASLRLSSATLHAPISSQSPTSQASTHPVAGSTPSAPAKQAIQASRQAFAQPTAQPIAQPIQDASPTSVRSVRNVARARSNGRSPAAGMLPLGAAAQGYLAAVSARRQHTSQAAQEQDAAETLPPNSQQRATNRTNAAPAASEQPIGYGEPEEDVCPICGGMGYVRMDVPVGDPMFGHAAPCECKERQREERRRSDLRRISSLDAFDKKTFETFDYRATPAARDALEIARRYADDPQGWLILSGGYGVGKTHLAAAVANYQLSRGAHVFFSIVPDLLDHLRAAFAPSSESPFDEMFDRVREAGLLVLDDLGAENSTAWATEKLFQLINYRYNYRMPTVITTNHRLLSHIDERINSRLSDLSLVRHVAIDAPDYRQRHGGRPTPTRGRSGPRG